MDNPFQTLHERLERLEIVMVEIKEGIIALQDNVKVKNGSSTASRKEAAKYLGISLSTIINLEKSGRLKTIQIGGSIRYDWNHLDDYKTLNTK